MSRGNAAAIVLLAIVTAMAIVKAGRMDERIKRTHAEDIASIDKAIDALRKARTVRDHARADSLAEMQRDLDVCHQRVLYIDQHLSVLWHRLGQERRPSALADWPTRGGGRL